MTVQETAIRAVHTLTPATSAGTLRRVSWYIFRPPSTSLIAATLRWLEFTERRAVLVVSRDGFILWARSSPAAFKTGAFFRTSRRAIPIPEASAAARKLLIESPRDGTKLPAGVWFAEQCTEMTIFSENYDFTISLLRLNSEPRHLYLNEDDDNQSEDLSSVIRRNHGL